MLRHTVRECSDKKKILSDEPSMNTLSSLSRSFKRAGNQKGNAVSASNPATDSDTRLVRSLLCRHLGNENPDWFSPLTFRLPEQGNDPMLTVFMPHELFFRWYEKRGRKELEQAVRNAFGSRMSVCYEWPHGKEQSSAAPLTGEKNEQSSGFEDFLLNGRNRETVSLFRDALERAPSTLLLKGPSGSGKSHLIRAAYLQLGDRFHGRVVFLSGASLFSESRPMDWFRMVGHDTEAVLVDDLHLLEQAQHAQQTLAALLDSLTGRTFFIGALSSEHALLPELNDRLHSHLSFLLPAPDLDIRMRFAQMRMERAGLPENGTTALLLARRCVRLRHIQGVVEHVRLRYEQNGRMPSTEELNRILEAAGPAMPADADTVLAAVADAYGCTTSQLIENNRKKELSQARQIAMYLCRRMLGESYPSLGRIFGGRDHSTIMYAVKKIEKIKVTNKDVHILITKLTKQCANGVPGGAK